MKIFEQSPEDITATNDKNGSAEKLQAEADKKFSAQFFDAVRTEKARKLYPERGGDEMKPSWFSVIFQWRSTDKLEKLRCERNVYNALEKPIMKLMFGALKNSGCEVDFRRHIACEVCDPSVTGGYDPFLNQVVICQNTATSTNKITGVLAHELIHMYDFCRRKLDFNNLQHLACTEIRAANLTSCSFLSAFSQGTATPFDIKAKHKACVQRRAMASVQAVKDVTEEEAWEAVKSVFDKCYADLEPIGRRIRRNSENIDHAYLNRIEF